MGLETVTDIADLNPLWPVATDPRAEGDNHIRNLKVALQSLTAANGIGLDQIFFPGSWVGDADKFVTVNTAEDGYGHTTLTGALIKPLYEGEANTNAFTDALQTKLNGIETGADVTDATNVDAAGAVIHGDITEAEGFLRKTASETYIAVKTNLVAVSAPGASDDSAAGYAIGSLWVNTTTGEIFVCTDATASSAVWWSRTSVFPSPVRLPSYGAGELPSASPAGQLAYFSPDGVLVYSDSGVWKKVASGQEVHNIVPPAGQLTLGGKVPTVVEA